VTEHARNVLEFTRVLSLVGGRAASPEGRARAEALVPLPVEEARTELDRVRAVMEFIQARPEWGMPAIPSVGVALNRLAVDGGVLEPAGLLSVGRLLGAARELDAEMKARADLDPHLAHLREQLWVAPDLEDTIGRTVDDDGQILDSASKTLKDLRRRLRGAHQRIVRALDQYMAGLPDRVRVDDGSVSVREGRYVIPLRREGRREVGGIVHDESGTGATIFVEPPVAVELMNELRDLEREEQREIQRILRELSSRLHPFRHDLAATHTALVDMDALHARARAALEWRATPPALGDDASSGLRIVHGRHPLLLAQGVDVVPFDLELLPEERTLVISGPNTGGKSVFLKAVGLLTLMARSGIVPPVGPGTVLPGVSTVYADIGDEQSIDESLSTFSAHLATMREILETADGNAMVLMDELGTGTDPMEGAALARAILETLTARGCLTLASSHLGQLKALDTEGSGIVNASMQFDAAGMAPTYQLEKGRPGRSYGLAIARRLGLPEGVLDRAESLVDDGAARVEDLLARLEVQEKEARERRDELARQQERVASLEAELRDRDRRLRERERSAEERARQQARDILMDARGEVEKAIAQVKRAAEEDALEEAAREARRTVEEAAARQREKKKKARESRKNEPAADPADLVPGARVRIGSGTAKGVLQEVGEKKAVVDVSGLRMEVPVGDLVVIAGDGGGKGGARGATSGSGGARGRGGRGGAGDRGQTPANRTPERGWAGPIPDASYEIDLRGLRVDEVSLQLSRSLDGAILNDLNEVRIIHGKGTGAVKSRVRELLKQDSRVESFRDGHPGEGGSGVTLAVFR
jgi:DNA mismatch repair protein MutS2